MDLDINVWYDDDRRTWHIGTYPMRQNAATGLWETDATYEHEYWQVEACQIAHTPAFECWDWWVDTNDEQYALIEPILRELRAA